MLNNHHTAYRQAVLWPPIHAATDVLVKRRAAGAESYEVTWRLIHIWECVAITLASAGLTKVLSDDANDVIDRRIIREKLFGLSWDPSEQSLETTVGALSHGSVDKWVEILQFLVSLQPTQGVFLPNLVKWLAGDSSDTENSSTIDLSPLVTAWSQACEVTPGVKPERVTVLAALRAVNSFRNRLAHVPFPYDAMQKVSEALSLTTEELFSISPSATSGSGPLAGAIVHRNWTIQGGGTNETDLFDEDGPLFVFGMKKTSAGEYWPAAPFIHIDGMFRPYVLTRVKQNSSDWEYTRFLAEANAVTTIRDKTLFDILPVPKSIEYYKENSLGEDDQTDNAEEPIAQDMGDVTSFIRDRNFPPAITYLENRTNKQPNYHVGWLRLGHARRELAVDMINKGAVGEEEKIRSLLDSSLEALHKAKEHPSRDYKSEAEYHTSKSFYRRWQLSNSEDDLLKAISHAAEALRLNPLNRFQSWSEFLYTIPDALVILSTAEATDRPSQ